VRAAAVDALQAAPIRERLRLALPLAEDPAYPVRVKVGAVLAPVDLGAQDAPTQARLQKVFDDYVRAQQANADRPESRYNLGLFHAERGEVARATADYRGALALQPDFAPAYANLAELYRQTGQDNLADATLAEGLRRIPGDPALLHAQGLLRVRQQRLPEALDLLARAARGDPANPRYAYIHAVALHDIGRRADALRVLRAASKRFPGDADIANALAAYARE
ncbi:MAG: tetratricopeptide repeat protein, partial [Xanthomonadales bacterium]|nr:tetratricopeptide repeat protein [Xanthomonadales bacterium]